MVGTLSGFPPLRAGMPVTSVRELRVLQTCKHPNLVELKRVVTGEEQLVLGRYTPPVWVLQLLSCSTKVCGDG